MQPKALVRGLLRELVRGALEQIDDRDGAQLRLQHAGVEPRDVEQRIEQIVRRPQRSLDGADDIEAFRRPRARLERGHEHGDGLQRLSQIVASRGEESGFREIGPLRVRMSGPESVLCLLAFRDVAHRGPIAER